MAANQYLPQTATAYYIPENTPLTVYTTTGSHIRNTEQEWIVAPEDVVGENELRGLRFILPDIIYCHTDTYEIYSPTY